MNPNLQPGRRINREQLPEARRLGYLDIPHVMKNNATMKSQSVKLQQDAAPLTRKKEEHIRRSQFTVRLPTKYAAATEAVLLVIYKDHLRSEKAIRQADQVLRQRDCEMYQ